MPKYTFCIFISILSFLNVQGQFVVKDVLAVDPQASIFDPEYNTKFNIVCWKSDDNELWISGLNPVSHMYEPADGKGTFVTDHLSPNDDDSWNGPEWMLSCQGTQVVYNKTVFGTRYPGVATQVLGGWDCETLFAFPDAVYSMATADYTDSTARFLFETKDDHGIYWLRNTDLCSSYFYPDVTLGFFARDNQQICAATNKTLHPGFIEVACTLPYFTTISQDTIGAPYMWNDPATNSRLFLFRTNGNQTIKVFQEISPNFWVLYNQFNSPLPAPFQFLTSPEPFTCAGHSYISFMAAQSGSGKDGLPAQIWIAGADPYDSLMWRVSDSTEAIRTDPEPVVFGDSAFVYYTHVLSNKQSTPVYSVRKCDTGLANLYTSDNAKKATNPIVSVYPNPSYGQFKLQTQSTFGAGSVIEVYDQKGRTVYTVVSESNSPEFNLSHLPAGNYILQIHNQGKKASTEVTILK